MLAMEDKEKEQQQQRYFQHLIADAIHRSRLLFQRSIYKAITEEGPAAFPEAPARSHIEHTATAIKFYNTINKGAYHPVGITSHFCCPLNQTGESDYIYII